MNVKLTSALSMAALFFLSGNALAQKKDSTSVRDIDEVVIVGYSSIKRDEFVGTASKINEKSIDNKNVSTVTQALAGESAGVRVINTSGQPGTDATIRIRGFGSVNGNRSPLYVVDGVPFSGNISSINPEDIESMTVLKDATATSIYGSRGANGVVVINTKKGSTKYSRITLESKVGYNFGLLPRYDVIKSPEEYIGLSWEALYNKGKLLNAADPVAYANARLFSSQGINAKYNMWNATAAQLIDPATHQVRDGVTRKYTPEDWEDYAFQPSIRTEHNLTMSGGSGKTTYYSGIGYLNDEGYSINSKFERYSARLNVNSQPKSWLTTQFNLGYAYTKSKNNGQSSDSGSVFWFVDNIPSIYPLFLRDNAGNKIPAAHYGGNEYDYGVGRGFGALTNSIADAHYDQNYYYKHELNANFFLQADITKHLSFETRLGGQYYNNNRNNLGNAYYGSSASQGGDIYKSKTELFNWNFYQLLRYKNRFGNHGFEAFAAHESTAYDVNYLSASKYGLIDPSVPEFNNAINQNPAYSYVLNYRLESYFGSANYDYNNKYLFSASVRRDGSSRFLNEKWGTFFSVGAGWLVSKENFLADSKFFKNLKIKASYGTVGDQAGVGYYPGYNVYNPGNFMGLIAATFDRNGYPDLTWEKSKIFQTGVEFSLFPNGTIEGSVDYYHKTTDNLIFDSRLAPSTGNAILKVNDGLLVNQGIEFNLVGHIIQKNDFTFDLGINGELPKTELTRMPLDPSTGVAKVIDLAESGFGRAKGHSIYDYYMREWAGVNPQTGAAQWVVNYVDANNDGKFNAGEQIASLYEYQHQNPNATISQATTEVYSQATQKFIGKSAIPDVRGAVYTSIGYKGFALGAQMLYSIGGYSYDYTYAGLMSNGQIGVNNWHKDINGRWTKAGDITNIPRLSSNNTGDTNYTSLSTRFLTKADYFVLNNVNLSYTLQKDFLSQTGLNSLTLTLSGDNLWIHSKRKGFNPSTSESGSSDTYRYSPMSTITFGVKATF